MLVLLLSAGPGADAGAVAKEGEAVLRAAAQKGRAGAIRLLARCAPTLNCNGTDDDGNAPLHYAAQGVSRAHIMMHHDMQSACAAMTVSTAMVATPLAPW